MKKLKKKIVSMFLIILIIAMTLAIGFYLYNISPMTSDSNKIIFEVKKGSSVYGVGKDLKNNDIIRNELVYKLYVKVHNINSFEAGLYELDTNYSLGKIIKVLSDKSLGNDTKITFKEGKTIRNVAKTIAENTSITEKEVLNKLKDENYINSLIEKYWFLTDDIKNKDIYYPLEGYLFPETYAFNEDVTVEEVFDKMLNQTDKVLSKYKDDIEKSKYSVNEIITMASIVESEGIYDNDRKMIAGVFYNRLNQNMSLGSDVTTYYAFKIDLGSRDITSSELNTYNPYNTRGPQMNGKLPIGPICNVGKISLEAALYPSENDYLFFVADKSGNTHFTKTYNEHLKKINELKASNNWFEW